LPDYRLPARRHADGGVAIALEAGFAVIMNYDTLL
jgi:hypothetical protein